MFGRNLIPIIYNLSKGVVEGRGDWSGSGLVLKSLADSTPGKVMANSL